MQRFPVFSPPSNKDIQVSMSFLSSNASLLVSCQLKGSKGYLSQPLAQPLLV